MDGQITFAIIKKQLKYMCSQIAFYIIEKDQQLKYTGSQINFDIIEKGGN